MKRRILRIAVLALGGLVGLGVALLLVARHMGNGTIQEWIGSQIQDVANGYLNPRLTFTDLSYQYPLTVSLKNLHLTADDPANPGHKIDIIACDRAEVSLGEIPSIGKPIIIEKIALTEPLISAIAIEPGSKKFVGFSGLIKGASDTKTTADTSSSAPKKLSDVFRMRLVQIINGKIVYDPRIPGTVPMTLDKINTLLNIVPTTEGWYKLDTDIARAPVFDFSVKGQLNLDSFSVKDVDLNIQADLGQDKLFYLPPEIQALLKQYDAKGKLGIEVKGDMPITDPMSGTIQAKVTLDKANLAMSGLRIPVDSLSLESAFDHGTANLSLLRIAALGGVADLSGSIALNDRLDAALNVNITSMAPGRVMANPNMSAAWEDTLDLKLRLAASLMSLIGKAPPPKSGPLADLDLRDFHFRRDPVYPGQRLDLVACKKLDVDLTQPVISGKPLMIDKIDLESPVISAVSVSPGSLQFVGIPALPPALTEQTPPAGASPAVSTPAATAPKFKVANTVQVKSFQFNNAKLIYDPRLPNTERMIIDQFSTAINVDPNDPGSYKLRADIDRSPVFKLGVDGEINIDDPGIQNLVFDMQADLSQGRLDFLPPQLQLILKKVNAREKLAIHAAAAVAMSDPTKASADLNLNVQNIDLSQSGINIPVQDFVISARLHDKKAVEDIKLTTLGNTFNIHASSALNPQLDTDVTLGLDNIVIEPLLAALYPDRPKLSSTTIVNAQLELQSPLMVALGAIPGRPVEPDAIVTVKNFSLSTDDNPLGPGPLTFFSIDDLKATLLALPVTGKPIAIGDVAIDHPVIKAIALAPQSNQYAGFYELQNIAASQSPPPATETGSPSTMPAAPAARPRLSRLATIQSLTIDNTSVYYDPKISDTVPMSMDQIAIKAHLDSPAGNLYRFDALIPSPPDQNIAASGRADVDSLVLNPVSLDLSTRIGQPNPDYKYLPPQVQATTRPYDLVATVHVKANGTVPLTDPLHSDVTTQIALDNVKFTAAGYRLPIDQVSLPIHYSAGQVEFLPAATMNAPTLTAFEGTADLTGTVLLNDRLDSTLSLKVKDILIQSILADKIAEPKRTNLLGDVCMDLELTNAPVLQIIAEATHPPTTQPTTEPAAQTQPDVATASNPGAPKFMTDLPASWGTIDLEVTQANLAGIELAQGVTDFAKSAFQRMVNKDKVEKAQIVPKENAKIVGTFVRDRLNLTQIHYEGEDLAADGKGYVALDQSLDIYLTGGLFQKLGGFMKQISDSLLYYHIYGTFHNIQYEVHRGDGKPIVRAVQTAATTAKKGIKVGLNAVGKGMNQAGKFLNGLFHHKKQQDQDQSQQQSQDQSQDQNQQSPDQSQNPPTTQN